MKTNFSGYYPPSAVEYERLWKEALIVLDTNVLLNLYRLPTTARDELFGVLELLKERLWIPHQVALEFQRRRLTVIAAERKVTEEALSAASEFVDDIKSKVDELQIDKRGLEIESQPLLSGLEEANSKLMDAIKTIHEAQLDISATDPVRDRIDDLLNGRVGKGPSTQEELDGFVNGGDDRYNEKIPPGFADSGKDKNPNEATFIFDHIKYQRKFGDLILWRQVIQYVKDTDIKTVLLITADRKEDWWWREQGKTVGPHPELVREIHRDGGVELFWMYSFAQFVEHANKYSTASVSNESVAEIEQVASFRPEALENTCEFLGLSRHLPNTETRNQQPHFISDQIERRKIEYGIEAWLSRRGGFVERNSRGFPDFLVKTDEGTHGYEVKYLRSYERMLMSPLVINGLLRGYFEINEGRLSSFTLIIVIPQEDFFYISQSDRKHQIYQRLERIISRYPVDSIVVGAVVDEKFEVIAHLKNPKHGDDFFR
jgi:hypothetical protein